MATSSFGKQFTVQRENAADFVDEMAKTAPPTLQGGFQSRLINLSQDKKLQSDVEKVFDKNRQAVKTHKEAIIRALDKISDNEIALLGFILQMLNRHIE